MKMIKRSTLLGLTITLAVLLLIYTFLRVFFGIKFDETGERYVMNGIMLAALGIFVINRKIAAQEKQDEEEKAKLENEKVKETDEPAE